MAKDTIAVHWEAAAPREPHDRCAGQVEEIRQYHKTHGYNDIAYSWVVCNHGQVFYGRGWGNSAATCGTAWNSRADSVCWMGGPGYSPTSAALDAIRTVILQAQALGMWNVIGHRDACATQCPGDDLWGWVHSGFPGGGPPPPPPKKANPGVQGMLFLNKQTGLVYLVGPGHAHHVPTEAERDRLKYIGVPFAEQDNGLHIIGWGRTFGVPNWDQAETWQ